MTGLLQDFIFRSSATASPSAAFVFGGGGGGGMHPSSPRLTCSKSVQPDSTPTRRRPARGSLVEACARWGFRRARLSRTLPCFRGHPCVRGASVARPLPGSRRSGPADLLMPLQPLEQGLRRPSVSGGTPMGVTSPRRGARVTASADDVPVLIDDGNAARPGQDEQTFEQSPFVTPREVVGRQDHQRGAVALRARLELVEREPRGRQRLRELGRQILLGKHPAAPPPPDMKYRSSRASSSHP